VAAAFSGVEVAVEVWGLEELAEASGDAVLGDEGEGEEDGVGGESSNRRAKAAAACAVRINPSV
jgi:hypothetical protein